MRIFSEENKLSKALQISNYLHNTYPMNSIFHRYYTQLLYRSGYFDECEIQLNELLKNILRASLKISLSIVMNIVRGVKYGYVRYCKELVEANS